MNTKPELIKRQQKIIAVLSIILVCILVTLFMWIVGRPLIRFVSEPDRFRDWVQGHGIFGPILYVFCVILQVVIAIIPGEPLELVGGYAFGTWLGTGLCLIGIFLGSVLVFGLVRRYGIRLVEIFFSEEKLKELKFLKQSPKRTLLFTIIYVIPGTPKDLLCYFAGLTDMKWKTFMLISLLGRLPSLITSTIGGDALGTESYIFAIVILSAAVLLGAVGLLAYRYICNKQNKEPKHFKKFVKGE